MRRQAENNAPSQQQACMTMPLCPTSLGSGRRFLKASKCEEAVLSESDLQVFKNHAVGLFCRERGRVATVPHQQRLVCVLAEELFGRRALPSTEALRQSVDLLDIPLIAHERRLAESRNALDRRHGDDAKTGCGFKGCETSCRTTLSRPFLWSKHVLRTAPLGCGRWTQVSVQTPGKTSMS